MPAGDFDEELDDLSRRLRPHGCGWLVLAVAFVVLLASAVVLSVLLG